MARLTVQDLNVVARAYHFFIRLNANFGWRFVVVLLSAFIGVKGVLYTLGNTSYLPYIRVKVGVTDPTRYQAFLTVARLPWALKAMIGLVSDLLPVAGLHKRYYILGSAVMGTTASVVLSAAPIRRWGGGVFAAVLLFLVSLESATGASWKTGGRGGVMWTGGNAVGVGERCRKGVKCERPWNEQQGAQGRGVRHTDHSDFGSPPPVSSRWGYSAGVRL